MKQIRVLDNFGNEYFYPVEQAVAEISIGRSQGNDIILGSKTVSRRHAIIKVMGDRILLVNQSANGCLVNGQRVDRVHELQLGEPAQIDVYMVSVEDTSAPQGGREAHRSAPQRQSTGPTAAPSQPNVPRKSTGVSTPNTGASTPKKKAPKKKKGSGRDLGTKTLRSTDPEDVRAFLGFLAPQLEGYEEPRVSITGKPTTVVPKAQRDELVRFKAQLHDELKDRLDLHSFEITDYRLPRVVRQVSEKLKDLLTHYQSVVPAPFTPDMVFKELMDEVCGLGPIEDLLKHRKVTEVMVVDRDHIYAEIDGQLALTDRFFNSEKSMMTVIERIVIPRGRRIDESTPLVDTRLEDGSRVNAVIRPLALKDPCLTIRKFPEDRLGPGDLIRFGSFTAEIAKFLARAVRGRKNIVISGGTGSGKTTLLNVLSSFIGPEERVVTIEDAAELQLQQEHVVSLETKPPNLEGKGAITIRHLVKNALRMRPDRIVVGECRGGEALDMLQAMNTGHDGSMTTVHSNSPSEAISRLETLVLYSGMDLPTRAIRDQISNSVDLIVQQSRFSDGSRRITYVTEVCGLDDDGYAILEDIYRYKQTHLDDENKVQGYHMATGYLPSFVQQFIVMGLASAEDFF